MHKRKTLIPSLLLVWINCCFRKENIYRRGWIDFNKNAQKDIYEYPTENFDLHIAALLSQMTMEEKTITKQLRFMVMVWY